VLVRHSLPEIAPDVPAADWRLSQAGAERAALFARQVDPGSATTVFTSEEPKARETAQALAGVWGLDVEAVAGLREHARPAARLLARTDFEERVRRMFARPHDLVFGAETAEQARRRFTHALMRLIAGSSRDVIVVSHGTVITLFVAEAAGVEPFAFWRSLQMPCAVTLAIPELTIVQVVG
jgi:broad specificity phosphatase PhoE